MAYKYLSLYNSCSQISDQSSATVDYVLSPEAEGPSPYVSHIQPVPLTKDGSSHDTLLFADLHEDSTECQSERSTPVNRRSPVISSLVKVEIVTEISPAHRQSSTTLNLGRLPASPTVSSFIVNSPTNNHHHHYQHQPDQATDVSHYQYSRQLPHHIRFTDNRSLVSGDCGTSSANSRSRSSCTVRISTKDSSHVHDRSSEDHLDLRLHRSETDINNNSDICGASLGHSQVFLNSSETNFSGEGRGSVDFQTKGHPLPPFSAFVGTSTLAQGFLRSNNSTMRPQDNLFNDDDNTDDSGVSRTDTLNSVEEEIHYTNLTDVNYIPLDQGEVLGLFVCFACCVEGSECYGILKGSNLGIT